MAIFDWSGLMKLLEEQKKLNAEILDRVGKVEARLSKLEKMIGKKEATE